MFFNIGDGTSGRKCPARGEEEYNQNAGDRPGKLKQLRNAKMKKRMIANVPKAAVVLTNPLRRRAAGMAAPICLAKVVEARAMKIMEFAGEHRIPIVENLLRARCMRQSRSIRRSRPSTSRRSPR